MAFFALTPILEPSRKEKILKIAVPEDMDYTEVFDDVFSKYLTRVDLLTAKTVNMGSLYDLTYSVRMKAGVKEKAMLDDIRTKNCNLKVSLSQPVQEEEL